MWARTSENCVFIITVTIDWWNAGKFRLYIKLEIRRGRKKKINNERIKNRTIFCPNLSFLL